ncbi:chitin deacetylase 9 precursor [Tribolium castaneum]|uniref:Chitin deacetylase 9 n=1 Tax=Tribolium castaneum TaxID=7070 RepID=A8W495_TRICA|nr:chitin deacetylase 9 precursor [Tribolium castaneum]ABW74152.1 chitin deacetylase 9 [Tribolium castaneum]EFA00992.1 hypothetical protein TcasGA2_TC003905 [Tribolium castaneum]|eukprot:NP_001103904.1 chitin deacetylase 9 precursor [Tribolium castaneum]
MLKIFLLAIVTTALAAPQPPLQAAEACDASKCKLPECRCASTNPPEGLDLEQIPQFVFLTFDDAVQITNYEIYTELFYNKTNPDGCPVQATFFLSHEYTDYTKVHELYVNKQEIALHSITHQALTDYWRNLTLDGLQAEFGDEATLITHFANIPQEAFKGMRIPFLQLSGDNSFQFAKQLGLTYDCSWPTQTFRKPGLWPYTLNYKSNQDCPIGPCPQSSIPGVWVVPMIDWTDLSNNVCSMVDACVDIPDDDADKLLQWFIDNFNVQYKGNKAPFGFYIHAAYFAVNPVRLEAYKKFVDYLQGLNDVYLVSPSKAIEWIKNPVPMGAEGWPACPDVEDLGCTSQTCQLMKEDDPNPRYMTFCGSECPAVYPWLGNPLGEK